MSDHKSVQETEAAAAGKTAEALEAMRRLLMQQRGEDVPKGGSEAELRESFQKAYRENGVDEATATAAARDAAIGLGSKDSPAMAKAEDMAVARAQTQAKEYRQVTEKAASPEAPEAERQQATARRAEIEQNLGIRDQPIEVKAQTINSLDPQQITQNQTTQNQQAENHPLSVKRKALLPEQAELKVDYQTKLEKGGVLPQTAEPASYDMATGKGAKDSRDVATAQQALQRHQLLKSMYQGVYEKHGVSPEVAAAAADRLAKGNGANRSSEVRKAHEQALNNISYAQQISDKQTSQPTQSAKSISNKMTAAQPASGEQDSQTATLRTRQQTSQQQVSTDRIWAKFSP